MRRVFRDFPMGVRFLLPGRRDAVTSSDALLSLGTMRRILHINFARTAIKSRSRLCILYRDNSDQEGVAAFPRGSAIRRKIRFVFA